MDYTMAEFQQLADYALELRSKAESGEIQFEEYRVELQTYQKQDAMSFRKA